MDWLALLHVACLLPTLGLIFGTSCCCQQSTTCASCSTTGSHHFPLCSGTSGTVSITFTGIANQVCTDCATLNRTIVQSAMCGSAGPVATITLCGAAGSSLHLDHDYSVLGAPGACRNSYIVNNYGVLPSITWSWQGVDGPHATTESQCDAIEGAHGLSPLATFRTECDITAATCTMTYSGI